MIDLRTEIRAFASPGAFAEFRSLLEACCDFQEIATTQTKVGFIEHRFKDVKNGDDWRLVEPDFPFRGLWERSAGV